MSSKNTITITQEAFDAMQAGMNAMAKALENAGITVGETEQASKPEKKKTRTCKGKQVNGQRCPNRARKGKVTCGRHKSQEPRPKEPRPEHVRERAYRHETAISFRGVGTDVIREAVESGESFDITGMRGSTFKKRLYGMGYNVNWLGKDESKRGQFAIGKSGKSGKVHTLGVLHAEVAVRDYAHDDGKYFICFDAS